MAVQPLAYASRVGDGRIGEGVPDHAGRPATEPFDFFAPPPADLGPLRSAESTLRVGREPWPLGVWAPLAAAVGLLIFGIGYLISTQQLRLSDRWLWQAVGVSAGAGTTIVIVLWSAFRQHRCTYVGMDGVARVSVRGRRDGVPRVERLLFADAAELRAHQVRQHVNGAYVGTNYDFRWTDPAGRTLLRLRGSYRSGKKKPPKPRSPFHFVRAAEMAWSQRYLERAQAALRAEGAIPFRVDRKRWLRVGPGFLEFHFGDEPTRVEKADIAKVTLGNGTFAFQHRDAKWFSRSGKYSFQYGAMANAQVFLLALDRLMGYRWG